ncbi:Zinc finger, GRF-type [Sesbania bispinosa]|nr:Zinc finger, GRF-type [Sesbania bispinosa]
MAGSKIDTSSSSSRRRMCECGLAPLVLTSNSLKNPGRRFLRCPNWKNTQNRFFQWVDDFCSDDEVNNMKAIPNRCARCDDVAYALKLNVREMQKILAYKTKKMNLVLSTLLVLSWIVMCAGFLMGRCGKEF